MPNAYLSTLKQRHLRKARRGNKAMLQTMEKKIKKGSIRSRTIPHCKVQGHLSEVEFSNCESELAFLLATFAPNNNAWDPKIL